jgi:hypothetical protein
MAEICGVPNGGKHPGLLCGFSPDHEGRHSWESGGGIIAGGTPDMVNHPPHYISSPSGVECITVVEWMTFNQGNAIKYLWRLFDKGDPVENLRKAIWYCEREIKRMEAGREH